MSPYGIAGLAGAYVFSLFPPTIETVAPPVPASAASCVEARADFNSVENAALLLAERGKLIRMRDKWPRGVPMRFDLPPRAVGCCGVSGPDGIIAHAPIVLQVLADDGTVLAERRLDPTFDGPELYWREPTWRVPADSARDGNVSLGWRLALLDRPLGGTIAALTETRQLSKTLTLIEDIDEMMDAVPGEAFWASGRVVLSRGFGSGLCLVMFDEAPPQGCTVGAELSIFSDGIPVAKFRFWSRADAGDRVDERGPTFILNAPIAWSTIAVRGITAEIRAAPDEAIKDLSGPRYVSGGAALPVVAYPE